MLSKGEVILKVASDFVGSAIGQSEEKTKAILEAAKGHNKNDQIVHGSDVAGGYGWTAAHPRFQNLREAD